MQRAPLLILGYARTEKILKILDFVSSFGERGIYVSLDGPKSQEIAEAQAGLIEEIGNRNQVRTIPIRVRRNQSNQGVAVSVIAGIDWLFENEKFGIIVEDDLEFSYDFLNWCEFASKAFIEDSQIFMVSGNRFNQSEFMGYTHYSQTWGWATWKDRWFRARPTYVGHNFNFGNIFSYKSNFWTGGTLRVLSAVIDTWDIALAKYMKDHDLLCVLPPNNLVSNLGVDSFSTHTFLNQFPIGFPITEFPVLPKRIEPKDVDKIIINDRFLEREVFDIRPKHWLSLLKNLIFYFRRFELDKSLNKNTSIIFFP